VAARPRREWVRDERAAARVDVHEILAREHAQRVCRVEAQCLGGRTR
jgi:hypothetical protein